MAQTDPSESAHTPAADAKLAKDKAALRTHMRAVRTEASIGGEEASQALRQQVMDQLCGSDGLKTGVVVAGYVSIHAELDPGPALEALREKGAEIALPVTGEPGEPLVFRTWQAGEGLEMGRFGTFEPNAAAPQVDPDVVLVPLLAFDGQGNRLGFGGGYYDRTLSALRSAKNIVAYGVAFEAQEVAQVPTNALDARLDGVFTPSRFVAADHSAHQ